MTDAGFFLVAFLFTTTLALFSIPVAVPAGDAGELTCAVHYLTNAHPPGYPLYVLFGKCFSFLPLSTEVFRLSLFSAVAHGLCAGAAVVAAIRLLKADAFPEKNAVTALTLWLFSGPRMFASLRGPEVYPFHHLLTLALLAAFLGLVSRRLGCFFFGLSAAHHPTTLLLFPAWLWWLLSKRPFQARCLLQSLSFFFVGASAWLLLPLRSHLNPPMDWGNPQTAKRFLNVVLRRQYAGEGGDFSLVRALQQAGVYGWDLVLETWGGGLAAVVFLLWKRRNALRPPAAVWMALAASWLGLCLWIHPAATPESREIQSVFFPPILIWMLPCLWVVVFALYQRLPIPGKRAFLCILLAAVAARGISRLADNKARWDFAAERVSKNTLLNLPRRAVLYSEGDTFTFPIAVQVQVRKRRADVTIFDRTGGLFQDLYGLVTHHLGRRVSPAELVVKEWVYEEKAKPEAVYYSEKETVPGRTLYPEGLLFRADRFEPEREKIFWRKAREPALEVYGDYLSRETTARFYLFRADFKRRRGELQKAKEDLAACERFFNANPRLLVNAAVAWMDLGEPEKSLRFLEEVLRMLPDWALAWYDRGVALEHLERREEAIRSLERCLQLDPTYAAAWLRLGKLLWGREPNRARVAFERYLRLEPQGPYAPDVRRILGGKP